MDFQKIYFIPIIICKGTRYYDLLILKLKNIQNISSLNYTKILRLFFSRFVCTE